MKKLLQINPVARVNTSTGRIMQEIGEVAMAAGWESYIAYSKGRDGIWDSSSQVVPVGNKVDVALHGLQTRLADRHGLGSAAATRQFIGEIERIAPDVIHIHNIHGYFLNYKILFDYLRRSGIPVVWTVHDCWLYTGHCYYYTAAGCDRWKTGCHDCPQQRQFPASLLVDRSRKNWEDKRQAFTSLAPGQLTIVPVSEWIRDEMSQSFLKDCNFQVIHNGINLDVFKPATEAERAEVLRRYGITVKTVILGVASIWSREKGLDDFVKMASMLGPDEQIVLVGIKPEQAKGLPANIVAIARTADVRQLAQLYSAATIFANPTWQDNYPTVNLEAIASGTPVATYRTGGSVESVTPATGFVVERGDVAGLLTAAREVASKGKEAYADACRAYALANFSKEARYADYITLYNHLTQPSH